ncbi:hypothetical protein BG015_005443 [Linnemannia schmuckeri]|uniref:Copper transport protein n=1 Tax=Linnemannia schmuckeri TaxID=64567 RepID=A0A9P5S4C5_9FUNG|nr:hypothetical protein BG015_005443 [Linnemannia schmuckeri]
MDHSMASGFKPGLGSAVWSPDLTPMSEPQYIGALIGLFLLSIGFRALVAAQGYLEAYLHLHFYPRPSHSSSSPSRHNPYLQQQQHQQQQVNEDDSDDEEDAGHRGQQNLTLGNSSNHGHAGVDPFPALPHPEKSNNPSIPLPQQGQGMLQQQSGPTPSAPPSRKRYSGRRHHSPPPFYAASPTQSSSLLPFLTFPTAQPFIWQAEVARAVLTTAVVGIGYMLMLVIMTYNSAYLGVILAGVFIGEVYFARWGRVRPIFPPSSPTVSKTQTSHLNEMKQQQQSSDGTTTAVARPTAISRTSLASTTSSHGYSTAMALHSLSGDGSC